MIRNQTNTVMLMRYSCCVLCIALMVPLGMSQSVQGIVYDELSNKAIQDAFIFVNDSSLGTISNQDGLFILDLENNVNVTLIVSHLGYENKTVALSEGLTNLDTIYLNPHSFELNEISLTTKGKKNLRKKRLKRFEEAFLGAKSERQDIEITNPEVLLFYEEGSKLMAKADKPLIIQNNYLGYTIRFFLTHFELYPNEDVIYKGTTSFTEEEKSKKELAKIKRNRHKVFHQTNRSFFYRLIHKKVEDKKFLVGSSKKNFKGEFVQFEALPIDSIVLVEKDDGNYELYVQDHFTVKYLDLESKRKAKTQKLSSTFSTGLKQFEAEKNDELVSYLGSSTNKIILDSTGRILNSQEVEEYGFWASKRVAYMLPLDYQIKL